MDIITGMVTSCENIYRTNKKIKNALVLCFRYWLSQKIRPGYVPADGGEAVGYLRKAYHISASVYNSNPVDISLCFSTIFMAIELRSFDIAEDMLSAASSYRNYYKNNEPQNYIIFLYLSLLCDLRQRRARPARKYYKMLTDYETAPGDGMFALALAGYHLEMYEYDDACFYLTKSYESGCRSVFLFAMLHDYYANAIKPAGGAKLLGPYLEWSIMHSADIKNVIEYYRSEITRMFAGNMELARRTYAAYPMQWLLKEICGAYMEKGDYSAEALRFYKETEVKQIMLPELNSFLIKASYRNKIEDISRYSMAEFLKENDTNEMPVDLRIYIYHILLTSEKLKQAADEKTAEIMQFCMYCLENNIQGRMCNSIYKLLLDLSGEYGINAEYVAEAESILLRDLFTFEVRTDNPSVRYIWIGEKVKKDMTLYEIINGAARVEASDSSFTYLCLGDGMKSIIDERLSITRLVENADDGLYMRFFDRGADSFNLLAALSVYCLSLDQPPPYAIEALSRLLACPEISVSFKMQTSAALGNLMYQSAQRERAQGILYGQDKYYMALEYYKSVDENYLNDKYIEQMLMVFVNTKEYERAAWLLYKKPHCISDRTLFYALKQLAPHEAHHPLIADTAYELLLKSWYDKNLIDIVLKHYNGSHQDWQELSRALANISVSEPGLDEIIIKNSIWMHMADSGTQKVFTRMYINSPDNTLIGQFAYYMVYEMLVNNYKLDYETMVILEKIYTASVRSAAGPDKLLAYALCHLYIEHNITTFNSDEIIHHCLRYTEEDGILFPVFKKMVDKKLMTPYIERNQPFIYRSVPDKNVWLYYRTDDTVEYTSKKMKYVRFGIYTAALTHFYGENIYYYFSEEMPTGSIVTKESSVFNNRISVEEKTDDLYFEINNALIYEQMFKYEQVEAVITDALKDTRRIKGMII